MNYIWQPIADHDFKQSKELYILETKDGDVFIGRYSKLNKRPVWYVPIPSPTQRGFYVPFESVINWMPTPKPSPKKSPLTF